MTGTVLIIDEDVNAQIIAETLLRLRGLDVYLAGNLAEATALLAREHVSVVVVDLNGSESNGTEGVRRLRITAATLPIRPRLVVLTDRCEPELERFAQRLGADAVLRRPIAPGRFIATVERLAASATPQAA